MVLTFTFELSDDEVLLVQDEVGQVDPDMVIKKVNIKSDTVTNVGVEELRGIYKNIHWNREQKIRLWSLHKRASGGDLKEQEPKLFQLKSDSIELYFGYQWIYPTCSYFYFLKIPSGLQMSKAKAVHFNAFKDKGVSSKNRKKKAEVLCLVNKSIQPDLMREFEASDFREISIEDFAPGFSSTDYDNVNQLIRKNVEFKKKLTDLSIAATRIRNRPSTTFGASKVTKKNRKKGM